jgi:putative transposase
MTTRRRKRHSPEQIVETLRDATGMLNGGKDLAVVLQSLQVSQTTYDRWRAVRWQEGRSGQAFEGESQQLVKYLGIDLVSLTTTLRIGRADFACLGEFAPLDSMTTGP